jgi:hypothetical protein
MAYCSLFGSTITTARLEIACRRVGLASGNRFIAKQAWRWRGLKCIFFFCEWRSSLGFPGSTGGTVEGIGDAEVLDQARMQESG